MKIKRVNNSELVIQARSKEDFKKTQQVAEKIVSISGNDMVVCSECEFEYWIHLTSVWNNYQAADFRFFYKQAKIWV